jgi:trigger factor
MASMKTEFTDVSETRKHVTFEVPADVVDSEITRMTEAYGRSARVPGFRKGKVPARIVRQRFKEQILQDVAQDLIPRLVGTAIRERGLEPITPPDVRDVVLAEGQPLTFLAEFETLPPIDPGDYVGLSLTRPPAVLEVGAVDRALDTLQERHARWHPVEDRPAESGDTLLVDLTRQRRARLITIPGETPAEDGEPESLENVSVELGAATNPPGFDEPLIGAGAGDERAFTVTYPADYQTVELQNATVHYRVQVKGIRRRELLPLDDDFAKEVSDTETLEALRDRIREDLQHQAEHEAEHEVRHALLQQLATRLPSPPDVLVDQEIDRRLEEFVRRMVEQGVDPAQLNLDWRQFRERQRAAALDTVRSTLVLDEIARREGIGATDEDLAGEIEQFAARAGGGADAIRARLEQEGALPRIRAGIRREKTVTWLLERAQISS